MQIKYMVQIWKEGNQFIAHAMPLDVMSSDPSPEEARRALDEALRLFVLTAKDHETLEEILGEAGYELRDGVWAPPPAVAFERQSTAVAV